jgi:hypothetical protein
VHGTTNGDTRITILNISTGGLMVRASTALIRGAVYEFVFELPGAPVIFRLKARVAHLTPISGDAGNGCLVGCAFPSDSVMVERATIAGLLEACTSRDC